MALSTLYFRSCRGYVGLYSNIFRRGQKTWKLVQGYAHLSKLPRTSLSEQASKAKFRRLKNDSAAQAILKSGIGSISAAILLRIFSSRATVFCKSPNKLTKNRLLDDNANDIPDTPFDWREFLRLVMPDIWYLIVAITSAIGAAFLNIQIPLQLGEIINVISKYTKDTTGNFFEEMKVPALKIAAYYILQGMMTFVYISFLSTVGENVAVRMRTKLFEQLLKQDMQFFDKHRTGELIDRLTADVQDFKSTFKLVVSQGLRATTQSLGCVASLFIVSPKLTSIMIIVIPLIIGAGSFIGSTLRSLSRSAQAQSSRATAVADEAIGNVRTVRAFAMEAKEGELYREEVGKSRNLNIRLGVGIGAFQGLSNVALNGIALGTMFLGGWLMSRKEITAGDLMSFLVTTQTIERSLAQISLLFGQVIRGLSAGSRIFEFINSTPTIPLHGGDVIPHIDLKGDVEFKNVSFAYPSRSQQTVLKDFSLKVPGGSMVALVGLSGGGKSTVAVLLERFYDVQRGSITLDGKDLKELDPSWLRGHVIGFINQEPILFATSVMENIRYGYPEASDDEVIRAAKLANAHSFIETFPDGYKTVLGERGVTVSGGQKQRIAIARALIKDPSVLLLDEATSALDAESEKVVQEAIDAVSKGRTVLVIAHRLSTIRDANLIAVVSNGRIVETGTHNVLKKKKGLYWELIKHQELETEIKEFEEHN